MKRNATILILVLCAGISASAAVTKIEVIQNNGFLAEFTADGSIQWSGGVSASIYDGAGVAPIAIIGDDAGESVSVSATFSQLTDDSSGGWAKATFQVVDWRVDFSVGLLSGFISGTNAGSRVYTEVEGSLIPGTSIRINENQLFGDAIVTVTDYDFGFLGALFDWADPKGSLAGMESHIWLDDYPNPDDPSQLGFDDYNTDGYSTLDTTFWIVADETTIPEPATMILLGLGSLVALRKRK